MLLQGFEQILSIEILLTIVIGVLLGIVVGSIPGLTSTMTIALLLPFTFGMSPLASITLMVSVFIGGTFGGSVASILMRIPGTPAAAATVFDGYPLAQKGEVGKAISTVVVASTFGGLFSVLTLTFFSPLLAKIALQFGAPEFFALTIFGLSIISSVSADSPLKGVIAACFGLLVAMIGMDPTTAAPRFTFGTQNLMNGINLVPALIGLFGVSEILINMDNINSKSKITKKLTSKLISMKETIKLVPTMLRSSFIGTFIGSIPGTGADIAAFISYNEAKRWSKNKEKFGKGSLSGIASPESGNNGVTGGTMIPLLVFGIPGDAAAAVMLGAFLIHGIQPGPKMFQDDAGLVFGLFAAMIIANIFMFIFGISLINYFKRILSIDLKILLPIIFVLTVVGSYALNNTMFDVFVMLGFGTIGYLMRKGNIPIPPIILAIILGPMIEENFRQAMIMNKGSVSFLYERPIALIFLSIALLTFISAFWSKNVKANK